MAEGGFDLELGDFDAPQQENGDDYEDETSFILPEPNLEPLDGLELQDYADRISRLTGDVRAEELRAQRDRLVDSFYETIKRDYNLRPTNIEYDQFEVGEDGKTLYWKVGSKAIQISTSRGPIGFLRLNTLARNYGAGGTQAIRDFLNLPDYYSKIQHRKTSPELAQLEEKADAAAKANDAELDGSIDDVIGAMAAPEADPDTPPLRELRGLDRALRNIRGEKVVQESKRLALQQNLDRLGRELDRVQTTEEERQVEREIQKTKDQLDAIQDSIDTLNLELRSQVRQIRETLSRVFDKDVSLAERIRTLFCEQGVTVVTILTAMGIAIGMLVTALTGGGTPSPAPAPGLMPQKPRDLREWVKKHL